MQPKTAIYSLVAAKVFQTLTAPKTMKFAAGVARSISATLPSCRTCCVESATSLKTPCAAPAVVAGAFKPLARVWRGEHTLVLRRLWPTCFPRQCPDVCRTVCLGLWRISPAVERPAGIFVSSTSCTITFFFKRYQHASHVTRCGMLQNDRWGAFSHGYLVSRRYRYSSP